VGFAHSPRRGAHHRRRRRGGQLREGSRGVGRSLRRSPRVEGKDPSSIFGTLGVVRWLGRV
jgi:hypothetical protein